MREFAARGFNGASIRGIAKAAGVSPGLVQHHFTSKENLREACNAYVYQEMERYRQQALEQDQANDPIYLAQMLQTLMPGMNYLVRMLADGGPAADMAFDTMFDYTKSYIEGRELSHSLPESADVDALAAVQTAHQIGILFVLDHLYRKVGTEPGNPAALARIGHARLDLTPDFYINPESVTEIREALDRYAQTNQQTPRQENTQKENDDDV